MQLVGRKEMAVKMKSARFLNFFFEVALILHRLFFRTDASNESTPLLKNNWSIFKRKLTDTKRRL